ncbi:uncharacterized protein LOC133527345 isoform X1 [Cydia pomonella]|uniref:uncharacterized protein LOC133527345 isoform X1 n=1 Tax=Cydia pomonella TaxID=82600 RepID=UPI002ADD6FDE|nr:uncharacterized protein LOC133527345 isoform X1 [Cydia pomonella]
MAADTETEVLREYYSDIDYLSSPEGIMKLIAILGCLCSAVLFLAGGGCAGAAGLAAGGASVAFITVGLLAVQLTATLLGAPLYAPQAWLYSDVVGSSVLGALLVLSGALSVTLCELRGFVSYVHAVSFMRFYHIQNSQALSLLEIALDIWEIAHCQGEQLQKLNACVQADPRLMAYWER